jgi:uncharacterized protein with PIN domain
VSSARLHLHGDLVDFTRTAELSQRFDGHPALKDVIEAAGVPHPEIDLVLADGAPAPLDATLRDGVTLDVFPADDGPAGVARLLPAPLTPPRFVLDGHLGRLASLLRTLGFDTRWERDPSDAALAELSAREERILLTRDVGLLKRSLVRRGAFVRATAPLKQGQELVARFHLRAHARPFTRCLRCNGLLHELPAALAAPRVPPRVRERQSRFVACDACGGLYWPGTHHDRMTGVVAELLRPAAAQGNVGSTNAGPGRPKK